MLLQVTYTGRRLGLEAEREKGVLMSHRLDADRELGEAVNARLKAARQITLLTDRHYQAPQPTPF